MQYDDKEALSKKIARSLTKGFHKEIYVGIFIDHDEESEPYTYYEFLRSLKGKETLKELGQVLSFNEVVIVCTRLSQIAQGKGWSDLTFHFNSLMIEDDSLAYAKDLGINLHIEVEEINALSKSLFDAGATTTLLGNIYFSATEKYPRITALESVQNEKADFFTSIKSKSQVHDPVEEILTFVEKNNLHQIRNSYDESLLCIISSIAYQYYHSDEAVAKLIQLFGAKQVLMSRLDPISDQIMQALEVSVDDLTFNGVMISGNRWFIRHDDKVNRMAIINKDCNEITSFAKQYLDLYIESQEAVKPNRLEKGEKLLYMIQRIGNFGLVGEFSLHNIHEDLNALNLNLIKEIINTYIDTSETPLEWFESFLNPVKVVAKYETEPVTDVAFSYESIRDYLLSLKPIEVDPMAHFNPLRVALIQSISSRERDVSVASRLLTTATIKEVGKALLYTDDVIAFVKHYDIDPLEAMNYIEDNELQSFCLSLISK